MFEQNEEAKKVIDALSDYVNYNRPVSEFIKSFKLEHRTLQQSMMRLFLKLIEDIGDNEYHTDGRNEATKKVCSDLLHGFRLAKKEELIRDGVSPETVGSYLSKPSNYLPFI